MTGGDPKLAAKGRSLPARMGLAVLAGLTLLIAIGAQGWLADSAARLRDQERLADELREEVTLLRQQQVALLQAKQRELAIAQDWLDRLAIPRETILKTARFDASGGNPADLDRLDAEATLSKDGWIVRCWFDGESFPSLPVFHYLVDPVTGKILTKRIDDEPDDPTQR
jgi:hypothetical protein